MKDTIFREYDIRGKVGDELTIEGTYDLTQAIIYYFLEQKPQTKTILVGMDGRLHSHALKEEVCRALSDAGMDVIFIGTCPSSVLYFGLYTLQVDGGLMITASHNPKEYNGIKMSLGTDAIWGKQIQVIRELYKTKKQVHAAIKGSYREQPLIPSYIIWLVEHFPQLHGMTLSAVIDCGNGAAGTVMPDLVKAMAWNNVQLLYPEVDGTYPHHEADPTVAENMEAVKKIVQTTDCAVGIGLDGDCDRMAPMTKKGQLVLGDRLLALFAQPIIQKNPGAAVVFDIKSSGGLIELLEKWGAQPCLSATGHSNIKEQMKKHHALLGGEVSCHFFFKDQYFGYDDGIYAIFRLFDLLVTTNKSLDELLTIFPHKYSSSEFRIACPDDKKHAVVDRAKKHFSARPDVKILTLDGIRVTMPYGWGILRVSNTQPMLSMRFESDTPSGLQQVKDDFINALADDFDVVMLRQQLQES
jgi:phosphomannomutase / phosphoglucomutase